MSFDTKWLWAGRQLGTNNWFISSFFMNEQEVEGYAKQFDIKNYIKISTPEISVRNLSETELTRELENNEIPSRS